VLYQATGLTDGPHTLKIVVTGTHSGTSTDNYVAIDAIDLTVPPAPQPATYPVVPQQPGTAITLNGRDSDIILANYELGDSRLRYSTSEMMTNATIGDSDIAVLYGDKDTDGETVLNYPSRPTVTSSGGTVDTTWDAATGDLRLNYQHDGLIRVTVAGGGTRKLMLLLADKPTAETFWRQDTTTGPVLVRGTHLLRTATSRDNGTTLTLTGDNGTDPDIEVFTTARHVTWNGKPIRSNAIPVAAPVTLPALTNWKHKEESPEAAPGFDDSRWAVADKTTSNSVTPVTGGPVLFADDYGFHTGNTWYRGRFRATGKETGIHLESLSGGNAQAFSAWLNGQFLGTSTTGTADLTFPAGSVKPSGDNVLSVLTVNMGHEEDYNSTNNNKSARGLTVAALNGAPLTSITWRLQGVRGGEKEIDPVRGPLSTGGLYGERAGWSLPGYQDTDWNDVTLPAADTHPGVSWYRTTTTLNLPSGQDTSVGLTITDTPTRAYRATLFVNGWQVGNYVNQLGPQHTFPVPNGILNPHGRNTIAIAVWNTDNTTGGLGTVELTNYGSYTSPLEVNQNRSPGYDARKYAMPKAPGAAVTLDVPNTVRAGQTITATATVSVPAKGSTATNITPTLTVPSGWTASTATPGKVTVLRPGQSARFTWQVTAPEGTLPSWSALRASVKYTQRGAESTGQDERIIGAVPPAPPAGTNAVSDLSFLSASNGWGPVERDTSVGENQPGDGRPITVNGVTYAKGLGTNAVSDVRLYLGGACQTFSALAGVDDETNGGGTVTFTVLADGVPIATTPTVRGRTPAVPLFADIIGAQVLDLVVGNAGDGNGNDHGDWATPTVTCG
jgi:hypothetical protein